MYWHYRYSFLFWKSLADPSECPESKTTIKFVNSCPLSSKEWAIAASKMNCQNIENTCSSFVYHCVMNSNMTRMIEVCAPVTNILGKYLVLFVFLLSISNTTELLKYYRIGQKSSVNNLQIITSLFVSNKNAYKWLLFNTYCFENRLLVQSSQNVVLIVEIIICFLFQRRSALNTIFKEKLFSVICLPTVIHAPIFIFLTRPSTVRYKITYSTKKSPRLWIVSNCNSIYNNSSFKNKSQCFIFQCIEF